MPSALLLIDIQVGFDDPFWGSRNNPDAEANAATLLTHWRKNSALVIHIRHVSTTPTSPLAPGPGTAFKAEVTPHPGESIFEKSVNSAFIGTGLEAHLRENAIDALVIAGLTTPHCVSTSTRMAGNLGFSVRLVHDACAAFTGNADTSWQEAGRQMTADEIHIAALSHLHGEFADVVSTDACLSVTP